MPKCCPSLQDKRHLSTAAAGTTSQQHLGNAPASRQGDSLAHSDTQLLERQLNLAETLAGQDVAMPGTSTTTDSASTTQGLLQTANALSEEAEDSILVQRQANHDETSTSSSNSNSSSNSISSSISRLSQQGQEVDIADNGVGPINDSSNQAWPDTQTSYNSSTIWKASSEDQEIVNSNATGMQLSFLGTASSVNCKTRYAIGILESNVCCAPCVCCCFED